jgi:hypothetical protein
MAKVINKPATTPLAKVATTVLAAAPTQPVVPQATVLYTFGKVPRNGLNSGTKYGANGGGTASTWAAVSAALKAANNQALPMPTIKAITTANGDKGFAAYAVRMHWLAPVVVQGTQVVATQAAN